LTSIENIWFLLYLLMPTAAFLYAAVGHGGASSYLMFLSIFNFAPEQIRPTALLLNIFVSFVAFIAYRRSAFFHKKIFWTLIAFSVPAAYLGGTFLIETFWYKKILGVLLFFPILRFLNFFPVNKKEQVSKKWWLSGLLGLSIGFVSGLIGIGGGIILSPILLILGWTNMKETALISALFIFLNSIAGFLGADTFQIEFDQRLWFLMPLTLIGGVLGAYLGAKRFNHQSIKYILTIVLFIAAIKLLL
jgi:uncharacterized protein